MKVLACACLPVFRPSTNSSLQTCLKTRTPRPRSLPLIPRYQPSVLTSCRRSISSTVESRPSRPSASNASPNSSSVQPSHPTHHPTKLIPLQKLCLRQNSISSINLPESLSTTLQDLELYDNLISHVTGLDSFTELRSLDLSYNKIKHIKRVHHLKNLHHLYFVQNKISHIEGLHGLDNLTYLELGANRIRVFITYLSFPLQQHVLTNT